MAQQQGAALMLVRRLVMALQAGGDARGAGGVPARGVLLCVQGVRSCLIKYNRARECVAATHEVAGGETFSMLDA